MTKKTGTFNEATGDLEKEVIIRELEDKKKQISDYALLIYSIRKELLPRPNVRPDVAKIERLINAFIAKDPQRKAAQDAIEIKTELSKDFLKTDYTL